MCCIHHCWTDCVAINKVTLQILKIFYHNHRSQMKDLTSRRVPHDGDQEKRVGPNGNKQPQSQSRSKKLRNNYYILVYKYFVGAIAIYEAFAFMAHFIGLFTSSIAVLSVNLLDMTFSGWGSYQLAVEFLAIHNKDIQRANKAVRLIKAYVIVIPLLVLIYSYIRPPLSEGEQSVIAKGVYILGQVISAGGVGLLVGVFYLYGAMKVRDAISYSDSN